MFPAKIASVEYEKTLGSDLSLLLITVLRVLTIIKPRHEISKQYGMCSQQSLRSACAYAQTDQSLCKSLEFSVSIKLLTEYNLEFLSLKGGCTGSSESTLVKMPHC